MERESFEDDEVAALLNAGFVCIKVDREERPDIDTIYMTVCQAFTGQGGWPLTIVMTPEQKPFFAATYLPKQSRGPHTGMMELLPALKALWEDDRDRVEQQGEATAHFLKEQAQFTLPPHVPHKDLISSAVRQLSKSFDAQYGGFSPAPKFPMAHTLLLLLRHARLEGGENSLRQAEATLLHMYRGGLFDHIGGGFSRYSTDRRWLVPHFEKMLYDNALLILAYLEGYAQTGKDTFRYAAEQTLAYALRELQDQNGGFYCGQDADSEGVEGKYYVFTPQQLNEVLPPVENGQFCKWFGITQKGNFEGGSIPNLLHHTQTEVPDAQMQALRVRVFGYRQQRIPPATDDKLLTAWNALMIAACAKAHRVLGDENYLEAAQAAQACVERYLTTPEGDLFVRYRDGRADHAGQLADYAFYGWALLELYASSFNATLLTRAAWLARRMIELFWDEENGGFYVYSSLGEQLISRPKEVYDGAMPSGNSAAALLLLRLWRLTGEVYWREYADRQLAFFCAHAAQAPSGHCFGLLAAAESVYPSAELVCVSSDEQNWADVIPAVERAKNPHIAVLMKTPANAAQLHELAPFTQEYPYPKEGTAYYLCKNGACQAPVHDLDALKALLAR